ncbi:MAG: prepilin-type N-terminal cleavage/methylation domain-containing protein [Acidobacteria bacterium]|nr:prepilin-type N-terminal cleavage/methylation domain-containing protein [Acidobacteriota bacterium]
MRRSEQGVSLVETMIAVLISMFVMTALGGVVFTATVQNKNQGVEMSRVAVYAQDKIETLTNLDWSDCTQSTPLTGCNTTGITGTGWNRGLLAGGSLTYESTCPSSGAAVGYIDYLDANGNQYAGADCTAVTSASTPYAYVRQWQITDEITTAAGTPGLKRIDVHVWSKNAVNTGATAPSAMLTTFLSE